MLLTSVQSFCTSIFKRNFNNKKRAAVGSSFFLGIGDYINEVQIRNISPKYEKKHTKLRINKTFLLRPGITYFVISYFVRTSLRSLLQSGHLPPQIFFFQGFPFIKKLFSSGYSYFKLCDSTFIKEKSDRHHSRSFFLQLTFHLAQFFLIKK